MKKVALLVLLFVLSVCAVFANGDPEVIQARLSTPAMTGKITVFEKYGHALLDIKINDFIAAGYTLGDTVDVEFGNGYKFTDIPFFNGYYVEKGKPMLRAYPGHENIAVCINYGKVYEVANLSLGDTCTIRLNTKGGALETQMINSLVYTKNRSDYSSDAVFANFRMITAGNIAPGRLYRSASPIESKYNRGIYADKLAKEAGIRSVVNLANSHEEIGKLAETDRNVADSYYLTLVDENHVVALNMPVDFSSPSFAKTLVSGITAVVDNNFPTPVLIHCTEGKDRAGFASALIEALMGASEQEIIDDYMISYSNYYNVTPSTDEVRYNLIVKNNIMEMLKVIKGSADSLQTGAERFLTNNGMTADEISGLRQALSR